MGLKGRQAKMSKQQQESFSTVGMTYVGPTLSRYGRLKESADELQRTMEWITGYLFIVSEHFGGDGDNGIPAQTAISYLEETRELAQEALSALLEVDGLARELREAMVAQEAEKLGGERPSDQGPEGEQGGVLCGAPPCRSHPQAEPSQ
jgi:hypothetical protein